LRLGGRLSQIWPGAGDGPATPYPRSDSDPESKSKSEDATLAKAETVSG